MSTKQKINTKSSTEAELVGVDDAMNFVVWSKLFFDWQFKEYNPETPTSNLGKKHLITRQYQCNTIGKIRKDIKY